ncbi:type II secretion system protein GspG [Phragmitibacter flavus]|uniref:Type II secretion system protein GspG n=1 Tax=Phragmitibacter flavus TaxID=2576071 RepID=A0A5R8KJS2_9BACT|nr:type II secretion system major pseudopilin GspG [Phragmitibacter flavus]TLD72185.1 type II secretion system protein GspG [Phragmitibacter flavus]
MIVAVPVSAKTALKRGFTLMEMMLVLFIIALIVGGGVMLMQNVGTDAEISKAQSDIRMWETNMIRYKTKALIIPTQQQGLEAMVTRPTVDPKPKNWLPMAKPEALTDPWGRKYQYRNPGKRNPSSYDIFSAGPDGLEDTEDDVGNW